MEKNKKAYLAPALFICELDEIMETVPWSPTPDDPAAKENNITFDDWDEDESIFKDLWAEDEEEEKKELW